MCIRDSSITVQLVNRTELLPLLQHICTEIRALLRADLVHINMLHESGNYLETVCTAGDRLNGRYFRYPPGCGASGVAWQTRSVQYIVDYQSFDQKLDELEEFEACASIPVFKNDTVVGTIDVGYTTGNSNQLAYASDFRAILDQLSQLTSVAIENASLHEATMATLAKTTSLNELSKRIHSKAALTDVLRQCGETVLEISDAAMVSIIEASIHGPWLCCDHTVHSIQAAPRDEKNATAVDAAAEREAALANPALANPAIEYVGSHCCTDYILSLIHI